MMKSDADTAARRLSCLTPALPDLYCLPDSFAFGVVNMHGFQRFVLGTCGLAFLVNAACAQEPVINATVPGAVAPGATTNVLLQGGNLNNATKLWTNFPVTAVL